MSDHPRYDHLKDKTDARAAEDERLRDAAEKDLERRLTIAGLTGEEPENPTERGAWRAQQLHMEINDWIGCPEPLCKRMRGCMAPRVWCTNTLEMDEAMEDEMEAEGEE